MVAFILAAISAFGWIILAAAICGAMLTAFAILRRFNRAIPDGILRAIVFIPLFFWELLKKPRDLFHLLWLLATAPFAIAIGIVFGFCDFLRSPVIALKRQTGSQFQRRRPATKPFPQMKN